MLVGVELNYQRALLTRGNALLSLITRLTWIVYDAIEIVAATTVRFDGPSGLNKILDKGRTRTSILDNKVD